MKIAYVSGPYRAPTPNEIDENIRRARELALALWRLGYMAFCPHLNTAHFDGAIYPDDPEADRQVWLRGDLAMIDRLEPGRDVLVMRPGWRDSTGSVGERAQAIKSWGLRL